MPNEAEHELIMGVMTSDWPGCGLLGRGEVFQVANCGARLAESGGEKHPGADGAGLSLCSPGVCVCVLWTQCFAKDYNSIIAF